MTARIANIYKHFRLTTSKLQNIASSIAFIEHALHHHVTPKFATAKGQFFRTENKMRMKNLLYSAISKATKNLYAVYLNK